MIGIQLLYSLKVMVIGLGIVFLGLAILICILSIMGAIMGRSKPRKAEPEAKSAPAPVAEEPVMEDVPEEDQDELIAVITAALAMCTEEGKKFAIRRVTKTTRSENAWARAGRREALENKF